MQTVAGVGRCIRVSMFQSASARESSFGHCCFNYRTVIAISNGPRVQVGVLLRE